jgi:hypothetical protein
MQLSLFGSSVEEKNALEMATELKTLDPDHLTPIEALKKIIDWKTRYGVRS